MSISLADKITSAEDALHKLQTGSLREEVRDERGMVRFNAADVEKLRSYIAELKSQAAGGTSRGAIGVVF